MDNAYEITSQQINNYNTQLKMEALIQKIDNVYILLAEVNTKLDAVMASKSTTVRKVKES